MARSPLPPTSARGRFESPRGSFTETTSALERKSVSRCHERCLAHATRCRREHRKKRSISNHLARSGSRSIGHRALEVNLTARTNGTKYEKTRQTQRPPSIFFVFSGPSSRPSALFDLFQDREPTSSHQSPPQQTPPRALALLLFHALNTLIVQE